MRKYGPSRSELKFRLGVSVVGLGMLVVALLLRGRPTGPAMFEIVGIAGVFFGGTLLWAARRLIKRDHPDGL